MLSQKNRVVIIGRGKLSSSLTSDLISIANDDLNEFAMDVSHCSEMLNLENLPSESIFCLVHAGSGRLLPQIVHFCHQHGCHLVQASTGIDLTDLPLSPSFIFLEAPNLCVPIIKFMHLMEQASKLFKNCDTQIKESHQSTKKTVPGTALVMAQAFGKSLSDITSVRDQEIQRQLGIPEEHLDGHAAHWITVNAGGAELSFQSKILGRKSYALGLIEILKALHLLDCGRYHVLELVQKGLL